MLVDNHPVWTHCRPLYMLLWNGLKELREFCWSDHTLRPSNLKDADERMAIMFGKERLKDGEGFVVKIREVGDQLAVLKKLETGPYKPWETFKLLVGIVVNASNTREDCLRLAGNSPKLPEELESQEGSKEKFNEMWDKVLSMLPGRL